MISKLWKWLTNCRKKREPFDVNSPAGRAIIRLMKVTTRY